MSMHTNSRRATHSGYAGRHMGFDASGRPRWSRQNVGDGGGDTAGRKSWAELLDEAIALSEEGRADTLVEVACALRPPMRDPGTVYRLLVSMNGVAPYIVARKIRGELAAAKRGDDSLEAQQLCSIVSAAYRRVGLPEPTVPFRAPHHTIAAGGMAGSATRDHPGEAALATGGILFLDDFVQFSLSVIEDLGVMLQRSHMAGRYVVDPAEVLCGIQLPVPTAAGVGTIDTRATGRDTDRAVRMLRMLTLSVGPYEATVDVHNIDWRGRRVVEKL